MLQGPLSTPSRAPLHLPVTSLNSIQGPSMTICTPSCTFTFGCQLSPGIKGSNQNAPSNHGRGPAVNTMKLPEPFPTGTWLCVLSAGVGWGAGRQQLQGRDMALSWGCKSLPTLEDQATELAFSGKQPQINLDGTCSVHTGCLSVGDFLNLTGPGPQHQGAPRTQMPTFKAQEPG